MTVTGAIAYGGGFVIEGQDALDQSGRAVAGIGDVNGDGIADLLVSAPQSVNAPSTTYVVFGTPSGGTVNLADIAAGKGGFAIGSSEATTASANTTTLEDFNRPAGETLDLAAIDAIAGTAPFSGTPGELR